MNSRKFLTLLVPVLVMSSYLPATAVSQPFQLEAGTGCEHIVVATGPDNTLLAITSRTEHRGWRKARPEGLGFAFIRLQDGVPVLAGIQHPGEFPSLHPDSRPHTWQALDWQSTGPLAEQGALLAAAAATGRYDGKTSKPLPFVEFFTWDRKAAAGTLRLKRCQTAATPPITPQGGDVINALTLAPNGDVYVSLLSANPFAQLPDNPGKTVEQIPMTEGQKLVNNAVYFWRPGQDHWVRVVSQIPMANGLFLSPDGKTLAVNSFKAHAVLLYPRNPATGILSKPYLLDLGKDHSPDNLSPLEGTRASAMATPGFWSGLSLVLGGMFGSQCGLRPSATIWEINTASSSPATRLLQPIPRGHGVFSDATRFGDWWLCGKMLGEGIYCVPAEGSPLP